MGDHNPKHVHVYKNGKEVAKIVIPSLRILRRTLEGGQVMRGFKFKTVSFSNKKKQLELVYTSGKSVNIHFGSLGIYKNIKDIWIDEETKRKSVGIKFIDESVDYLPYDQPPHIVKDPEYMLQNHIENIISQIKEELLKKKISKKYLARQLGTSDNQIQRLLNPNILNKNLSQLYKLSALLGLEFEIQLKAA